MAKTTDGFTLYCCELLAVAGRCTARRMFGGYGISTDGLTFALVSDLGSGEKLWLKADEETRTQFEEAGCERFSYPVTRNGVQKTGSLNYYTAPDDAMESPHLMRPWALLAFDAALKAQAVKAARASKPARQKPPKPQAPASPRARRPAAETASPKARRKSTSG